MSTLTLLCLNVAISIWNFVIGTAYDLLTISPESYNTGMWTAVTNLSSAFQAIGYGLLVLCFAIGFFKNIASLRDLKRPETLIRLFIYVAVAKVLVTNATDLLLWIYDLFTGILHVIISADFAGGASLDTATLSIPRDVMYGIDTAGFMESLGLLTIAQLAMIVFIFMAVQILLTVYGRIFKLMIYMCIAPLPLATFASDTTSVTGKAFLKSFLGVCLEAVIILLVIWLWSAFFSSGINLDLSAVDAEAAHSASGNALIWACEAMLQMMLLVAMIKSSDKMAKELFGI